jgi:para-aminobenzoate synthetase/4-amino-4-deoxychorismate lyase
MTTSNYPRARFDDARQRLTRQLSNPVRTLIATQLNEVHDVLDEVEEASRNGLYCAGYVSFEAAHAFSDGSQFVATPGSSPLAQFALFENCETTPWGEGSFTYSTQAIWTCHTNENSYQEKVQSILNSITSGDVYQVNLTAMHHASGIDVNELYAQLVTAQQPAYGALLEFEDMAIVSGSPELFFQWSENALRTRPMKGTKSRGRFQQEDKEHALALQQSSKDQAENIMIVDLLRNDLGRVAKTGSVEVVELCAIEGYPTVWQMVSEISCTTRNDVTLDAVFDALFPCGSVTGAPKSSALRIISELEDQPRGVYCGAIGLVEPQTSGIRATFSVAIRTGEVRPSGDAKYGSGGGVVSDSTPKAEYDEMILKAEVLIKDTPADLLETFRFVPGESNEHIKLHVSRLQSSAAQLGHFVPVDVHEILDIELGKVVFNARVRLTLSMSGTLSIECAPAPEARDVVTLDFATVPVDSTDRKLFHKTTNRDIYESRRLKNVDDVILINERGECTETTIANFAVLLNGEWCTPPLSSGCLPGVERAVLLRQGVLQERVLFPQDVRDGKQIIVFNSLRGTESAELHAQVVLTVN